MPSAAANCWGSALPIMSKSSIGAAKEQAQIKVRPDGIVDAVIGTQSNGQGHETSFAQVVADLLHVPDEAVKIIYGDTAIVKVGGGSHSGRSMRHAATVFSKAAVDLIAKSKQIAAIVMGVAPETVMFEDGRFISRDTNLEFRFSRACQRGRKARVARRAEGRRRDRHRQ